jgi:hypothetical protein
MDEDELLDPRPARIPRIDEAWESKHVVRRAIAADEPTFDRWIEDARRELESMETGPAFVDARYEADQVIGSLRGLFADGRTFVAADERGTAISTVRCQPECLTFVYRPRSAPQGMGLKTAAIVVDHLFEAQPELTEITSSRTLGRNGVDLLRHLGFCGPGLRRSTWNLRARALAERFLML